MDQSFIDDLTRRLSDVVPPGARELGRDLEKNLRAVLQAQFEKLNLVSREEFDAQARVLERTRQKLTELERQVAALETHAGLKPPAGEA